MQTNTPSVHYRGRFAPSPTGALHLGSLACAMASYLDARAHAGTWVVRIEDIDRERAVPGADKAILDTLNRFGLESDEPVLWQSQRDAIYQRAFETLRNAGLVYGCACSRSEIDEVNARLGRSKGSYPCTCRAGTVSRAVRAWRFRVNSGTVTFDDRRCGVFSQDVEATVGDFVVRRVEGDWAYQLAVVVDDAAQAITDVVRGEDLLENTPRQILLQRALGLAQPRYMHIALVRNAEGVKLSKQTKAAPVDATRPLEILEGLLTHFGLRPTGATNLTHFWRDATRAWQEQLLT